jgi:hypothetical protein
MKPPLHITALFFFFLSCALTAPTLDTRANTKTHLYACTYDSFRGICKNMELTVSKCHNIETAFDNNVSSAGSDDGAFCVVYS